MATIYALKPAFQALLRPVVARLAAADVTANQVTIAAITLSLIWGAVIATTDGAGFVLLSLPAVLLLRMALNAIDGMLAREHGQESRLGFFLNELGDVVSDVREALGRGEVIIIFPEGTRGAPEVMQKFRRGASVLAETYPEVPFVPVHLHGLGKSLPRGDWRFVPFAAEARIGAPRRGVDAPGRPMAELLEADIAALARQSPLAGFAAQ